MAKVGDLYSSLTLESSSFVSGLKKAVDQTASSAASIEKSLNQIKSVAVAAFSGEIATQLIELGKRGLEYASSLDEVSQQLGVTARDLQVYRYAASQVGISNEEMDGALQKFTKTLGEARAGNTTAIGTFRQLGLSMGEIKKGDPHDVFLKAADGISQIRDRASRAAPEIALLGKTGQQLDTLLSQGSAGINGLAKAAEDLGIVLSHDQIENADRTADKLSELKQVLEANIAKTVADNAAAIFNLAEALEHAAVAAGKAITAMSVRGNLDVLDHPGLVKAATYLTGNDPAKVSDDAVSALVQTHEGRQALFDRTQGQLRSLNKGDTYSLGIADNPEATGAKRAELLALRTRVVAAERTALNPPNAAGATGGRTYTDPAAAAAAAAAAKAAAAKADAARKAAEQARQKALRQEETSQSEILRATDEQLGLRQQLTIDVREQARLQHEQIDLDSKATDRKIDLDVAEGQITAAAGKELHNRNEINTDLQHAQINRELDAKLDQQDLDTKLAAIDGQKDLLTAQDAIAATAKERREIELKLLALQFDEERARQEAVIASRSSTDVEKAIAQKRLDGLSQLQDLGEARVRQQTAGPLEAYRNQLKTATGDMSTALQGVEVEGLKGLEDGLSGIVSGTESVSKAFKNMAQSILADLAKIAIEKAIIGPLANSLFGSIGGSSGTFGANDNGSLAGFPDLSFATGGGFEVGGSGGPDSKLFSMALSPGEAVNVTKGGDTRRGNTTIQQTIQFSGGVDLATRTEVYRVANAVQQVTMAKIDERARRRG